MKQLPLVLVDAFPRSKEMIFTTETERALLGQVRIVEHYGARMPDAIVGPSVKAVPTTSALWPKPRPSMCVG